MRNRPFSTFSAVLALLLTLFLILPLISVVMFAFSAKLEAFPTSATLRWFTFRYKEVLRSILISLWVAVPAVVLGTLISLPLAYAIVRTDFPGKRVVDQTIMLPLIIPGTALGLALLQMSSTGALRAIHPMVILILAHTALVIPLCTRPLIAALEQMDRRLEEVAMMLGATPTRVFRDVTLPLMAPAIIVGIILGVARSITDFAMTLFIVRPGYIPLSIYIFNSTHYSTPQVTSAQATILLVLTLILVAVASRMMGQKQLV